MKKREIGIIAILLFAIIAMTIAVQTALAAGPSSQKVELGTTGTERVYPTLLVPRPGECGTDKGDVILQYNTYWGPRVDPDNVRWNSELWWVRSYISMVYPSGLSANGLSTTTTRVCMGHIGLYLPTGDIESIYLWHK